jgi:hypothetical protein
MQVQVPACTHTSTSRSSKMPDFDFYVPDNGLDMIIHKGPRSYVSIIQMSPSKIRVFARTGGKTVFEQDFPTEQIEQARIIAKNYANSTAFREQIEEGNE